MGGGGHCKSCIDVILSTNRWEIAGILDRAENVGTSILGYPVIGTDEDIKVLTGTGCYFLVCVGQIKSSAKRRELFNMLTINGSNIATVISPWASVSEHAEIGVGTIVHHHCSVNADVKVGENCIINTGSDLEHDVWIGDHTHVSTGAVINGGTRVGKDCFVGSGSVLVNGISITDEVVIGAGSLVLKSIDSKGTYHGVYKKDR